jgi:hypothetical protein
VAYLKENNISIPISAALLAEIKRPVSNQNNEINTSLLLSKIFPATLNSDIPGDHFLTAAMLS